MPTFHQLLEQDQIILIAALMETDESPTFRALLDTGAQRTMISSKVVEEAGLESIGYASIVPVNGEPFRTKKFWVRIGIPIQQGGSALLAGRGLEVSLLPFQPDNFDILLGMDLIRHFHFTMHDQLFILSN